MAFVYEGDPELEGFHIESLPQFNRDDVYSEDAMGWLPGMRAVWLLYRKGRWDHLARLGVRREDIEPKIGVLLARARSAYGNVLTPKQAVQLGDKVPELELASVRLRMMYALKYREQKESA